MDKKDLPKKRIPLPDQVEKVIDPDSVYNRKKIKKKIDKTIRKEIENYYGGNSEDE